MCCFGVVIYCMRLMYLCYDFRLFGGKGSGMILDWFWTVVEVGNS